MHDPLERVQARETERQALITNLRQTIIRKEDELGGKKTMAIAIILTAIRKLMPAGRERILIPADYLIHDVELEPTAKETAFLESEIYLQIKNFSPVIEEQLALVSELLIWAVTGITNDFHQDLARLTTLDREDFLRRIQGT
jgi:hypothetical protein